MPNDKDNKNGFFYELDKKAYEFIKKIDPTGLVEQYYEKTAVGKIEKEITKIVDKGADKILSKVGDAIENMDELLRNEAHYLARKLHPREYDNNKNLPTTKNINPLNR